MRNEKGKLISDEASFWSLAEKLIQYNLQDISAYCTIKGQDVLSPACTDTRFTSYTQVRSARKGDDASRRLYYSTFNSRAK